MLLPLLARLCACRMFLFVTVSVANANSTLPTLPQSGTPRRRPLPAQHSGARRRRPAADPNSCGHSALQRHSWAVGLGGTLEPLGQTSEDGQGDLWTLPFDFRASTAMMCYASDWSCFGIMLWARSCVARGVRL